MNRRGGLVIRPAPSTARSEEAFALLGFGLGRRQLLAVILAKLILRQEDQINQMNLDRTFLFFIQADKGSILPKFLQLSKDWHGQREKSQVTGPLRQLMFQAAFEELANRASQLPLGSNDNELIVALRSKQLTPSNS